MTMRKHKRVRNFLKVPSRESPQWLVTMEGQGKLLGVGVGVNDAVASITHREAKVTGPDEQDELSPEEVAHVERCHEVMRQKHARRRARYGVST